MSTFTIVGTGFILPAHVEAIRSVGGKIIDVVNTARGEDHWREIIHTTTAQYVIILAPNDLHYPMILEARATNKIVLCEKPLTIKKEDAALLVDDKDVFVVLQLRYHPAVRQLKKEIDLTAFHEIEMDISAYRDAVYHLGWKGDYRRSGGVIFNLGIHYFDLLLYLFGAPCETVTQHCDTKTASGIINGVHYSCRWRVSTDTPRDQQRRIFRINGKEYNFSSKDNLSYENLHTYVYHDLINNIGARAADALHSIALAERLYQDTPYALSSPSNS